MTSVSLPPLPASATALNRGSGAGPSRIPMRPVPAIVFGSFFALPGALVLLVAFGVVGDLNAGRHGPPWVIEVVGLIFLGVGLWIVWTGVETMRVRRRATELQRHFPSEPWRWDYPWSETGIADRSGAGIVRGLVVVAFLELFLTPFHWVGWFSPERPLPFRIFPLLFDAAALGVLWYTGILVARRRRFGRTVLDFERFPFLAGSTVAVSLPRFGQLALVPRLTATLRCVQERYEERGSGDDRSTQIVYYALWSRTLDVEPSRRGAFEMRFDLPDDAPSSELSARPARFWELELASGDLPGADYRATFLVPVYARGRAAR